MSKKKLYLIDATAFCYRAFYALRGLSTSFGQPTNAVYGFLTILNRIIKKEHPEYLAVCFDVSRETFRSEKFAGYKIQRPPMPDELSSQIPLIKQIVAAYGISLVEKKGYEADDIIATLAKKAKKEDFDVVVVSQDKDMLQIVDRDISVLSPNKDGDVIYDVEKVKERFSASPQQIPDIIALMGDDVDNIPGARGIGEKTAVELMRSFGSLAGLLSSIDNIPAKKIQEIVRTNIENIKMSKELAVLDADAAIDCKVEELKVKGPDTKELLRLFKYLEFKKMIKELGIEDSFSDGPELIELDDQDLRKNKKEIKEILIYGLQAEDMVFFASGKAFYVTNFGNYFKDLLADHTIKKIGYDLKKIKVYFERAGIAFEGLDFDVMIAGYLLNPSKGTFSLSDMAMEYLDISLQPESIGRARAIGIIRDLLPKLKENLADKKLLSLFHDIEMPLVSVLARMELNGIAIDTVFLKSLAKDLDKRLEELIEAIYKESGVEFNINSPKQLGEVLFGKLHLPVVKRTKTGPSTDEEVLRKLSANNRLCRLLLEYRQLMKLKTTYVDTLPQLLDPQTKRIHTSFNQTGTETGRLSSSNPNLQNLPIKTDIGSRIREAVVSSGRGFYLLACDYSQIELRILAHISGDEELIDAFKKGKDIHKETAALIYGLKEKDLSDQMRETAKRVNFGIVYGLTSYGLAKDLGISLSEAEAFIDTYFTRFPRVKEYIEDQIKKAKEDGFVSTILGRRRYLPEINNKNMMIRQFAERQAVNTPIQGSASDLIKIAMIHIDCALKEKKLATKMVLQVHDELVFDVPENELALFADLAQEKMEHALTLSVPIRVSIKKGRNWLEMEDAA